MKKFFSKISVTLRLWIGAILVLVVLSLFQSAYTAFHLTSSWSTYERNNGLKRELSFSEKSQRFVSFLRMDNTIYHYALKPIHYGLYKLAIDDIMDVAYQAENDFFYHIMPFTSGKGRYNVDNANRLLNKLSTLSINHKFIQSGYLYEKLWLLTLSSYAGHSMLAEMKYTFFYLMSFKPKGQSSTLAMDHKRYYKRSVYGLNKLFVPYAGMYSLNVPNSLKAKKVLQTDIEKYFYKDILRKEDNNWNIRQNKKFISLVLCSEDIYPIFLKTQEILYGESGNFSFDFKQCVKNK